MCYVSATDCCLRSAFFSTKDKSWSCHVFNCDVFTHSHIPCSILTQSVIARCPNSGRIASVTEWEITWRNWTSSQYHHRLLLQLFRCSNLCSCFHIEKCAFLKIIEIRLIYLTQLKENNPFPLVKEINQCVERAHSCQKASLLYDRKLLWEYCNNQFRIFFFQKTTRSLESQCINERWLIATNRGYVKPSHCSDINQSEEQTLLGRQTLMLIGWMWVWDAWWKDRFTGVISATEHDFHRSMKFQNQNTNTVTTEEIENTENVKPQGTLSSGDHCEMDWIYSRSIDLLIAMNRSFWFCEMTA